MMSGRISIVSYGMPWIKVYSGHFHIFFGNFSLCVFVAFFEHPAKSRIALAGESLARGIAKKSVS